MASNSGGLSPQTMNFIGAARRGDAGAALEHLQSLNLREALRDVLELVSSGPDGLSALIDRPPGTTRPEFALAVAAWGRIPAGRFSGILADDYVTARSFILQARDDRPGVTAAMWGSAADAARTAFYPEVLDGEADLRNRIVKIAQASIGPEFGPHKERQVALFSLGGRFGYRQADEVTKPKGTTCILFARAVLHAAGRDVLRTGMTPNVPRGLDDLPRNRFTFVDAAKFPHQSPEPGDVFYIEGGSFRSRDGSDSGVGSAHVGVICSVERKRVDGADTQVWHTCEGGASDHVSRSNTRTLVANSGIHGQWRFDNDNFDTVSGPRALKGWFSVEGPVAARETYTQAKLRLCRRPPATP